MPIIRRAQRVQNYTVIQNAIIEDPRLDLRSMGLLVYLLSKPDHWLISISHLAKAKSISRPTVYKLMAVLRECGYADMKRLSSGETEWSVFDEPQTKKPQTKKPQTKNFTLVSTESVVSTERKSKDENGPAKPGPISIDTYLKNQKAKEQPALPEKCAVIQHARRTNLPDHFLLIAWREFVERMRDKNKRQKDWPRAFLTYIRGDYMKLWAINREGEYYLTTAGKTAARAHEVAHD